ncbi:hypothetical protein [Nocardioides sp. SYSU DS0651]
MWNTAPGLTGPLSHDMLCPRCGHGIHVHLACGDGCSCPPVAMPGSAAA